MPAPTKTIVVDSNTFTLSFLTNEFKVVMQWPATVNDGGIIGPVDYSVQGWYVRLIVQNASGGVPYAGTFNATSQTNNGSNPTPILIPFSQELIDYKTANPTVTYTINAYLVPEAPNLDNWQSANYMVLPDGSIDPVVPPTRRPSRNFYGKDSLKGQPTGAWKNWEDMDMYFSTDTNSLYIRYNNNWIQI